MKARETRMINPRLGELREKARSLPEAPGVYIMKDRMENIIYVGKSACLPKRVSQYFGSLKNKPPKIEELVSRIDHFEYITTDTELDALLLECSLIKELRPMYNSQLKNDKRYPYIKLTIHEEYPRLLAVTEKDSDEAVYFGPYTSQSTVENALSFIRDSFPIRKCTTQALPKASSGCLYSQLGNCMGVCSGQADRGLYMAHIQRVIDFLEGRDPKPIKELTAKMEEASEKMDFEAAARLRDQLSAVKHLLNRQRAIASTLRRENIIYIEYLSGSRIKLFFIRGSRLLHDEIMELEVADRDKLQELLIRSAEEYFRPRAGEKAERPTQEDIDEAQIIFSYIRRKSPLYMKIPQSWLGQSGRDKLERGIRELAEKIYESDKRA